MLVVRLIDRARGELSKTPLIAFIGLLERKIPQDMHFSLSIIILAGCVLRSAKIEERGAACLDHAQRKKRLLEVYVDFIFI